MTQDEKDLLIKDLCSRLPYGVKVLYENEIFGVEHVSAMYEEVKLDNYETWTLDVSEVKPYLFPIASMSVEQRCKAQNLLPNKCEVSFINSKITFYGEDCCDIKLEQFDKLFKFFDSQHVDYRGLIPMGLAIDATGKNIY